jgi:hypothetical protein
MARNQMSIYATCGVMVSGGYEIEITCEGKALGSVPEQGGKCILLEMYCGPYWTAGG